jgi:hypothetical protein
VNKEGYSSDSEDDRADDGVRRRFLFHRFYFRPLTVLFTHSCIKTNLESMFFRAITCNCACFDEFSSKGYTPTPFFPYTGKILAHCIPVPGKLVQNWPTGSYDISKLPL